jgi:murein DD-endopeptidase MepM/ murein hydrolase activator NlpD
MAPGALPVTGALTSAFGTRINPITGGVEFHDGVDIGAPCGLGVQVLRAGLVTFAGWAGGYGMRVEVTHGLAGGEMVATSYSHLSGIGVATGNAVTAGSSVGVVGTTGFSTGCHLHYSVTLDGRAVDPLAGVP